MPPTKVQPLLSGGPHPLTVVRMLWKQKLLVAGLWLLLGGISAAVVYRLPAVYKAEVLILVDSQKIPERFVSSTVSAELQDRLATISQRILSATRLQKIIESFNLYTTERKSLVQEEILEKMRKDIKVTPEKGWTQNRPGAFRISYEGQNAGLVAEVANQLGNLFVEENLRAREVHAEGTSDFMKSQLEGAKKTLDELEAHVSRYKVQHNGELPQQEATLSGTLSRLQVQLQGNQDATNRAHQNRLTLESALSVAQATAEAIARLNQESPGSAQVASSAAALPSQPRTKKQSEILEERLALLTETYTDTHPSMRNLRASLERVKQLEARQSAQASAAQSSADVPARVEAPRSPEGGRLLTHERERVAQLQSQVAAVEQEIEFRKKEDGRILREIQEVQARINRLPIREQEMAGVLRDYEMAKANYKSLLDKIYAADMATEMERRQKSERFTVLDPAHSPEKPVRPNRPLFGGLAILASLGLSVAAALAREFKKNQVLGEWELPAEIQVLGRVPRIPATATAWERA